MLSNQFKTRLRALYISFASLIGFDVRCTRNSKCYFILRDKRLDHKVQKKLKRQRSR